MYSNKELASRFNLLGKVMDLHGENPFKIRSYSNAYLTLRKFPEEVSQKTEKELSEIKGIGKAIASKIRELVETGEMATLNRYLEKTPEGVQEMLKIKGFGAKKIRSIWKEMGIETIGELLYACEENRLIEYKGFGYKTQEQLKSQLEYYLDSKGYSFYANVFPHAIQLVQHLSKDFPDHKIELTGEIRRKLPVLQRIEILSNLPWESIEINKYAYLSEENGSVKYKNFELIWHYSDVESFAKNSIILSSQESFIKALSIKDSIKFDSEKQFFENQGMDYIPPELREDEYWITKAKDKTIPGLITIEDVQGVVHNHSTYSDGINTVEEMANACKEKGYSYLVMSDHSKSAFYANGLQIDRVYEQQNHIDYLNAQDEGFRIFKSVESDILNNGDLDYPVEVLESFDLVIASVHSNLKMPEEKATSRLIKAIENPFTRILGHPTGRLLLARKGYPIDHKKVIDACAENDVVIELNANPHRLDLDWTWIPYALEKGVMISINPDAHSILGIDDIQWGVAVARKGGLTPEMCLNAKSLDGFIRWMDSKNE